MSVEEAPNKIIEKFKEYFKNSILNDNSNSKSCIILSTEHLRCYGDKSKNTHSLLQYLLIRSGIDVGYHAIPEVKIKFEKDFVLGNKKRRFKKVDVAFAHSEGHKIVYKGLGEIYTIDGCLQCIKGEYVSNRSWIPARDLLIHLVSFYDKNINNYEKIKLEFIITVVVLPKKSKTLAWGAEIRKNILKNENKVKQIIQEDQDFRDLSKKLGNLLENSNKKRKFRNYNYYETFRECWVKLNNELNKNIKSKLIIITEKDDTEKYDIEVI
jgi:hypothetical protein